MQELIISHDVARNELNEWFDFKKVPAKKREDLRESVETVVDCIAHGTICIDEDKSMVQTLLFPLESIDKFTWKPRLQVEALNVRLKGISTSDIEGRIAAYAGALTGQPRAIFNKLDLEDGRIVNCIVSFFL